MKRMRQTRLHSLDELRTRQASLKAEQELLGKKIINQGKAAVITLPAVSLIKPADHLKILKVDGKINPPAKLFSYLLPLIVSRTLFRRSGFIKRMITTLIARRIGKRIGPKIASWLIDLILKYIKNLSSKSGLAKYRISSNKQQTKLLK